MIPAEKIQPGMQLDLEDDEYANMSDDPDEREYAANMFEYEYAEVEAVVRETLTCVRIDTSLVSFGCPPKHMLKVIDD